MKKDNKMKISHVVLIVVAITFSFDYFETSQKSVPVEIKKSENSNLDIEVPLTTVKRMYSVNMKINNISLYYDGYLKNKYK